MSGAIVLNKVSVEEALTPRDPTTPTVNSVAAGRWIVDGSASAGSKHVVAASGATDTLAEQIKAEFPANTDRVTITNVTGQGKQAVELRLIVEPGTDVLAANHLTAGISPARVVAPDSVFELDMRDAAGAAFAIFWVACPLFGGTLSSTGATVTMEGN